MNLRIDETNKTLLLNRPSPLSKNNRLVHYHLSTIRHLFVGPLRCVHVLRIELDLYKCGRYLYLYYCVIATTACLFLPHFCSPSLLPVFGSSVDVSLGTIYYYYLYSAWLASGLSGPSFAILQEHHNNKWTKTCIKSFGTFDPDPLVLQRGTV